MVLVLISIAIFSESSVVKFPVPSISVSLEFVLSGAGCLRLHLALCFVIFFLGPVQLDRHPPSGLHGDPGLAELGSLDAFVVSRAHT